MISTTIPIQGTFDIAKGRNSLRTHVAAQQWPPTFGARAAASLTALGELILQAGKNSLVIVRINIIEDGSSAGVQFECSFPRPTGDLAPFEDAQNRLGRASDQLSIQEIGGNIQVTAAVLVG